MGLTLQFRTDQESIGWELTQNFTPDLVLNQRLRYAHQTTDYAQLGYTMYTVA